MNVKGGEKEFFRRRINKLNAHVVHIYIYTYKKKSRTT